ncbi:guanine nucleotide-binding protein-like 1 [Monodon monoceros]|uniref:Guanine nucleotide-binding protein-like 1 n=2 Tax=Monodon monoceros TaxID=40151 RepID=A0A8C6BE61_MONMO|nr:guanine nucleotide-binding protein-like 1 [Monodon monoceros]
MPRKKPFSVKQKKKQLQDKRERKRGLQDGLRSSSNSRSGSRERREEQTDTSDGESVTQQIRRLNQQPAQGLGPRGYDPNRYRLHFERDSREEVERRKRAAREQVLQPVSAELLVLDIWEVYQPGSVLDFPRRPPWSYEMSKEQLMSQEERSFQEYLGKIHGAYTSEKLSYFEHNLETWRQLWRVLEMSDIVLLITDIRHPVVNFPPALYEYVTGELGLALVLVLNKVDLAPPALVVAWKHYFHQHYPQLHIVLFTSFPRDPRTPQDPSSVLKKSRRRGRGWTRALGPEQLLRACEAITAGKVDLSSWREKIARDVAGATWGNGSGEEEEEEDGPAVLVEQQTDSAMEPTGPVRERYKDGVVTIGCVGFPNVGKSSLINGLVGRKVVSVSRTPGHTRYFQTYFLTPSVKLCDCPGLIFPSLLPRQLQVLAGVYPIAQIQEPYTAVGYLASRIPVQALLHLRHPEAEDPSAEHPWCAWDICEAWAEKRGYKTAKAARNDVYRAANSLLRLALDGRLSLCFQPPGYSEQKGTWESHPETMELVVLQGRVGPAGDEEEEEEELSSSCEEEGEEDRDADEEGEGDEDTPTSAPGSSLAARNPYALLGEDEC